MEILGITFEDKLNFADLSFFILVLGLVIYYFGKIIVDAKPQKEDKVMIYFEGFYFLCLFILGPVVLIYSIYQKDFSYQLISIILLFAQFLVLRDTKKKFDVLSLGKINLKNFVLKEIDRQTRVELKKYWFFKKIKVKKEDKGIDMGKRIFEKKYLQPPSRTKSFFISLFSIFTVFYISLDSVSVFLKFVSFLFSFLTLSSLAIIVNHNISVFQIVLKNKKILNGNLMKISDDWVSMFIDGTIYNINKDEVLQINKKVYDKSSLKNIFKKP